MDAAVALSESELIGRSVRDPETGCWQWQGSINDGGYGYFRKGPRGAVQRFTAHRAIYELVVGPIPPGMDLDHLCRLRSCVNPEHLEPVTRQVNLLRGIGWAGLHAAQTHCRHGHEFTPENTIHRARLPHGRECRMCDTLRKRAAYAARQNRRKDG